jgi:hypothetical protein
MIMKKVIIIILITISIRQITYSQKNPMPIDTIGQYFNELKSICEKDNGNLWGKTLWSPIIVIDRKTRFFVASENDSSNTLKQENKVYTGYFPENLIIANSTTEFGGKHWTMVGYPLPNVQLDREILFIHEMFHRLQNELWKGNSGYDIKHIDNKLSRILLKLEWNALVTAINSNKTIRKKAITDALIFNYYRKLIYSGSDTMENRFEIMEGLAEYTAMKICLQNEKEIIRRINDKKMYYWNLDSYTRSFGYFSGFLYAFLLDFSNAEWRNKINTNSDLQVLLQNQLKIALPNNLKDKFETIKTEYGFDTISVSEEKREIKIQKIIADYKERLVIKPHLTFNLIKMNIGFNPTNLLSIDSLGTVYPNIQIVDNWGILKVNNGGCLLNNSWSTATINAENIKINGNSITGNDWELKLNPKWKIISEGTNYKLTIDK